MQWTSHRCLKWQTDASLFVLTKLTVPRSQERGKPQRFHETCLTRHTWVLTMSVVGISRRSVEQLFCLAVAVFCCSDVLDYEWYVPDSILFEDTMV